MSMFIQKALRLVIRKCLPVAWQYSFSKWVYSTVEGPYTWSWTNKKVLHRLYWLTNPRGESNG